MEGPVERLVWGWKVIWQPMSVHPEKPARVLFYVAAATISHDDIPVGLDYSLQLGFWDGRCWREQGTGHDLAERLPDDADFYPSHWMPAPPEPQP